MSPKRKLSINTKVIETTRIIFLASTVLIFIFSIFVTFPKVKSKLIQDPNTDKQTQAQEGCKISGCNNEACLNQDEPVYTICIYNEEFICYKTAKCEKQEDGNCGWTQTKELTSCLEKYK